MTESEPNDNRRLEELRSQYQTFLAENQQLIQKVMDLAETFKSRAKFGDIVNNLKTTIEGYLDLGDPNAINLITEDFSALQLYMESIKQFPDFMLQEATTAGYFPDLEKEAQEKSLNHEIESTVRYYAINAAKRLRGQI